MLTLAIFTVFVIGFAIGEASHDADAIAHHQDIYHIERWCLRAAVMSFAVLLAWYAAHLSVVQCAALLVGGAFGFSAVFRYTLNKLRGLHAHYISPSNLYDWAYLRPFMHPIDRTECVEAWHVYMASRSALQAGKVAYATEITIALTAAFIFL